MDKPIRKLSSDGVNWDINKAWIRSQIAKISNVADERELIEIPVKDNYGKNQTVFFSLEGSPSRGYAVYIGDDRYSGKLCVISLGFTKKKVFNDVRVTDLNFKVEKGI
jgi:hypothetical protein